MNSRTQGVSGKNEQST